MHHMPPKSTKPLVPNGCEENEGKRDLKKLRRALPHILLVVGIVTYITSGALIFLLLEGSNNNQNEIQDYPESVESSNQIETGRKFTELSKYFGFNQDATNFQNENPQYFNILTKLAKLDDAILETVIMEGNQTDAAFEGIGRRKWQFKDAFLLAFGIVTTIGYGDVTPSTTIGRIFCIFYAVFGIPLCVLSVANIGRFMSDKILVVYKKSWLLCGSNRKSTSSLSDLERIPAPILLAVFFLWVLLGALLIPLSEPVNSFEAFYFVIISLTTVGFGDVVPSNSTVIYITCLYLAFGLIITTMAIDVLAEYLVKLHYLGKKMKNMGKMPVWLGGQKITVDSLFAGVLKELNVSEDVFRLALENLDNMIEKTVEDHEAGISHYPDSIEPREEQNGTTQRSITIENPEPEPISFAFEVKFIDDDKDSPLSNKE